VSVLQESSFTRSAARRRCASSARDRATNKDLEEEIAAGRFREDLFLQPHVSRCACAGRERREDVPLLVDESSGNSPARRHAAERVSAAAMAKLQAADWSATFARSHVVERSWSWCRTTRSSRHLDLRPGVTRLALPTELLRQGARARFERGYIEQVVEACAATFAAAKVLGVERRTSTASCGALGVRERWTVRRPAR